MKNQKQNEQRKWGFYPGVLVPEQIDKLDEIDIWKKIDNLGGSLFWAQHDAGKPWMENIPAEQLLEAQYALEYLVYHTKKFGVEFTKEPSEVEHVEKSPSYIAWFEFWKNHFDSMTSEVYNAFVDDKFSGKDISKYMPQETWQDHYEKSKVKKIKREFNFNI